LDVSFWVLTAWKHEAVKMMTIGENESDPMILEDGGLVVNGALVKMVTLQPGWVRYFKTFCPLLPSSYLKNWSTPLISMTNYTEMRPIFHN
jgi:hypothetical protein